MNWLKNGGFDVPLFVPHTPRGELAQQMRAKEAENNQVRKIRFKIIEKGGVTLEQKLRKFKPWAGARYGRQQCFLCRSDQGGNCWREGVTYSLVCEEYGVKVVEYKGETGRNAYITGKEHLEYLAVKNEVSIVASLHSPPPKERGCGVFHESERIFQGFP